MKITTYLTFKGQCAEAFAFYAETLGGEIIFSQTFGESPMKDMFPGDEDLIMHATLHIGDQEIMGADAPPSRYTKPAGFGVTIASSDLARIERIFNAFADGGEVDMPLQETFWAPKFGIVTDRFGTPWMLNGETPA